MKKLKQHSIFSRRQKIHKKFESFKMKPKSKAEVNILVGKKSDFKKVVQHLFSKKTLAVAGVGGAVGFGVTSIWNYIESNSGCFKKNSDGSVCKVRELSCCQPKQLEDIPYCDGWNHYQNLCNQFDEEQEGSCCKLCTCKDVLCNENEEMQCQRPTVAEALSHFAENLSSGVWSGVTTLFPWVSYIVYGIGIMLGIWLLSWGVPILYRILPRKRNQDV